MRFFTGFLKNLALFLLVCLGLYFLFPQIVVRFFNYFGRLSIPLVILLILVLSLVFLRKENIF
jgi:hypothetical protein